MDNKFRSKSEIADLLGIPRNTFVSYYTGYRQIATPENRKKLFELTGIESFKSEKPNKQEGGLLKVWVDSVIDIKAKPKTLREFNNSSSKPFLEIATELRNWFNNQHQWETKKEFADFIGASRSTMKKVFLGVREPKGDVKHKLYDITKLTCFKNDQNQQLVQPKVEHQPPAIEQPIQPTIEQGPIQPAIQVEPKMIRILKDDKTKEFEINSMKEQLDDVYKLVNLFYLLAKALEPFKYGTSEQRKRVKDNIPPEDLGYVISFLKAMYDEDNFADFMFFSEYHMKGDKSE